MTDKALPQARHSLCQTGHSLHAQSCLLPTRDYALRYAPRYAPRYALRSGCPRLPLVALGYLTMTISYARLPCVRLPYQFRLRVASCWSAHAALILPGARRGSGEPGLGRAALPGALERLDLVRASSHSRWLDCSIRVGLGWLGLGYRNSLEFPIDRAISLWYS